jgi:hypothetical protein
MDIIWSSCMQLRPTIVGTVVLTDHEFDEAMSMLNEPENALLSPVMWFAWGRRSTRV